MAGLFHLIQNEHARRLNVLREQMTLLLEDVAAQTPEKFTLEVITEVSSSSSSSSLSVRNVPELFDAAQVGLDERAAVRLVLLNDVVVEAPEPAGVKGTRQSCRCCEA